MAASRDVEALKGVWRTDTDGRQLATNLLAKTTCAKVDVVDLAGAVDTQSLFAAFARDLRFAAHFGWNWNAFSDCLRDWASVCSDDGNEDGPWVMIIVGADGAFNGNREAWSELLMDSLRCMCREEPFPCCVVLAGNDCKLAGESLTSIDLAQRL